MVFGFWRRDSPVSVKRWCFCINRSRMASAIVASPIQACQCSMGSWPVMMVASIDPAVEVHGGRDTRLACPFLTCGQHRRRSM